MTAPSPNRRLMNAAEVARAALLEAGRPDLADIVLAFVDDDGAYYLEPLDDVTDPADLELLDRATAIMNAAP